MRRLLSLLFLLLAPLLALAAGDTYLLGVGRGDITGTAVEKGTGLKQRLYSRVFIMGSTTNPDDRLVYVILDTGMGDTAVRRGIVEALSGDGELKMYKEKHVAIIGTHSHSGPGGYSNYLLHQASVLGFHRENYQAIVDGTMKAIRDAHQSLSEGTLTLGTAHVKDANINRSLWAYLQNPKEERDKYADQGDSTDTLMTLLRLTKKDGTHIGALNWYATHGTSAHNNNTLVTGDNKGVAAWLMEQERGNNFVAGFSQANVGDVSPNTLGQWCEDGSNQQCNLEKGTCADGTVVKCQARGPVFTAKDNGLSSCYEIGRRQYATAAEIMNSLDSNGTPISGPVRSFHLMQDMRYFSFPHPNSGAIVETCPSALGFSFGAGTADGPGISDFQQSATNGKPRNPFWSLVSLILKTPSERQKKCQGAKPILVDIGEMDFPYAWGPNLVDVQLMRIGQLIMIIAPAEATTMAGRRWRNAIAEAAGPVLGVQPVVVLAGPSNGYTSYVVTEEEYSVQRYEGASTLFGPHTLNAHINLTVSRVGYLREGSSDPDPGPAPPDTRAHAMTLLTKVVYDNPPIGKKFGQVLSQPPATVSMGSLVEARFQGANPRNNFRLEGTYAAVEKKNGDAWQQVRSDRDWHLQYAWKRTNGLTGYSEVTISWQTGNDDHTEPGTYRLKYYGDSKAPVTGKISAFEGTSNEFVVQ
ncbi:neutral/alkaline non-lysosomal ceramidase [Trichosporon asahii var. asahii CBS 2479]|uniref:Neutral ceramidase n=1 Tax=Trichosporon asahii var. asahii (strain ATCC 90039 / CBS 2479 / JCM 2466 / KCTC 7840 / NBRC 103889/ NCYC 2677 / UAMH 7654) TaxID=1186058 RepID=J4UGY7_TRIAS|nr:neutral/alkaline non-lysosomal ceramidase [Trichosporon asahii var. asahii CBS 2479]EJT50800.1 neutral/alkaline non-lysosomal ceramidase [Trichosporon asahii var. asahii CBS 2479]